MTHGKRMGGQRAGKRYLTLTLVDRVYGIPLDVVREIRAVPALKLHCGSAPHSRGSIDVRGEAVLTVDLGSVLGLRPFQSHPDASVLVTRLGELRVALLVDRANEIVTVEANAKVTKPTSQPGVDPDLVLGTVERPGGPLLLLDGPAVIRRASAVG